MYYLIPEFMQTGHHSQGETNWFPQATGFLLNQPHFNNTQQTFNYYNGDPVLVTLASQTIPGAEYDSSDRHPPPCCHPGTRQDILEKLQNWLRGSGGEERVTWLVGSAGVGKSAIIQSLAESESALPNVTLGATLFFSKSRRRNDSARVFITIAYQLAVKLPKYREYIRRELTANPKLLEKSITTQFAKLIVMPFVSLGVFTGPGSLSVFLDGMDECRGEQEQCEILGLICFFAKVHPQAPLVWIIASRPEAHLKATLSRSYIIKTYTKVELPVNSETACADVEAYLRHELNRIRKKYPATMSIPPSEWPKESEFTKLAAAASGLFVFASTVIRFVDDLAYGDPVTKFNHVLAVIAKTKLRCSEQPTTAAHPLSFLDTLYTWIFEEVPKESWPTAKRLVGHAIIPFAVPQVYKNTPYLIPEDYNLSVFANFLGIPKHRVYGALQRLHSILQISSQDLQGIPLTFHHKSVRDFLADPARSRGFYINEEEAVADYAECALRVMKESYSEGLAAQLQVIHLSWPLPEFSQEITKSLYWTSLMYMPFARAKSFHKEPQWASLILQELDLWELALRIGSRILIILYQYMELDKSVQSELEKRGLLLRVPENAISFDRIQFDRPVYLPLDPTKDEERSFSFTDWLNDFPTLLKDARWAGAGRDNSDTLHINWLAEGLQVSMRSFSPRMVTIVGSAPRRFLWYETGGLKYAIPYHQE